MSCWRCAGVRCAAWRLLLFWSARQTGDFASATLYTVLSKFEEVKYIEQIAVEGRKRTYRITQRGVEAYNAEINRLTACLMDAETIGGLLHD